MFASDAASFIPGLGEIADGLNGLIYLGEGRYIEASVSALAMIPILGDLGKAGKWTFKVGQEVLEEVAEKIVKETAEEAAEIIAKESLEESAEKAIREVSEEVVEKAPKPDVEKATKDVTDNVTPWVIKDTASSVPE